MSSALFIGPNEEAALKAAVARARAHPIPWSVLKAEMPGNQDTDYLALADRVADAPERPVSEMVGLPPGWRVAISVEEQPAGWLLHVSISSPRHLPPNEFALRMILAAAGIDKPIARGWIEEFLVDGRPGGKALNVLFIEREREEGHG